MKTIKVCAQLDEANWDAFVDACAASTAYHQFAWNRVIARSFGHRCLYLAAIDETGAWQGVLPLVHVRSMLFGNSVVSLPFVNYG
ncbi:MAG: FemAB-like protein, partial [Bacteroidales bacterium]|nr:FemAB-like protein [Bacteroidales bacterium]